MPAIGRRGPKHEAVPGLANIEVHKAAGPVPVGGKSAGTLVLLKCSVAGCGWEATATTTRPAFHHSSSRHPGLGTHLFEPMSREEVELKKRQRRAESERERRSRVKKAKEGEAKSGSTGAQPNEVQDTWRPAPVRCPVKVTTRRLAQDVVEDHIVEVKSNVSERGGEGDHAALGMPKSTLFNILAEDATGEHGMRVAVTWAASQVATSTALNAWLGSRKRRYGVEAGRSQKQRATRLWLADEALIVDVASGTSKVCEDSLAAATAVSLVCLATHRRSVAGVAVCAGLDLHGNLMDVCDLPAKLAACKDEGIDVLLVTQGSIDKHVQGGEDKKMAPELQAYAGRVLRGVNSLVEILQLSIDGCSDPPPALAITGTPQAGVGISFSISYLPDMPDEVPQRPFVVEAALVRGGKASQRGRQVFLTGMTGQIFRPVVEAAVSFIKLQNKVIAAVLGLKSGWANTLKTLDVHVNLPIPPEDMDTRLDMYTSAVAVAVICCLTGRRQRRDTALTGHITSSGTLAHRPAAVSKADDIGRLAAQGFGRLVVGGRTSVDKYLAQLRDEAHIEVLIAQDLPDEPSFAKLLPYVLETEVHGEGGAEEEKAGSEDELGG